MKIVKLADLESEDVRRDFLNAVRAGAVFIHPTDTVYGLGCNIEFAESIKKIFQLKQREDNKPVSIVAPSKEWIYQNFYISDANKAFLERLLPGPYTVVLKTKTAFPKWVVKDNAVGVRIPRHPVTDLIRKENIVFTTTSLNIAEQEPVASLDSVPQSIADGVDIAINAGQLKTYPSRVFDLTKDEVEIIRP